MRHPDRCARPGRVHGARLPNETLILSSDRYSVDDEAFRAQVGAVMERLRALGAGVVTWTTSYYLAPAAMTLLGERNWYLPRWLGWLPRL